MKTLTTLLGRIAIILAAAFVVIGITMSLVDTDATAQLPPRPDNTAETASVDGGDMGISTVENAEMPAREFPGSEDQSLITRLAFNLMGIFKNLVIIGIIVTAVVWIERLFLRRRVLAT